MAESVEKRDGEKDEMDDEFEDDDDSDFYRESLDSDSSERSVPEYDVNNAFILFFFKSLRLWAWQVSLALASATC